MTFPVQVGPPTITINRDDRVLVCQPDGRILGDADDGFFTRDTRFVSGYELRSTGGRRSSSDSGADPVLLVPLRVHQRRACSTTTAPIAAPVARAAPRPDDRRGRPRGPRHRQLRAAAGPADHRDRDRLGLRRHLRRQTGRGSSAAATIHTRWFRSRRELRTTYRTAISSGAGRRRRASRRAAPVRQRPARLRRPHRAQGATWHTCLKWLPVTRSTRRARPRWAATRSTRRCGSASAAPARGRRSRRPTRRSSAPGTRPSATSRHSGSRTRRSSAASSSRRPACPGS